MTAIMQKINSCTSNHESASDNLQLQKWLNTVIELLKLSGVCQNYASDFSLVLWFADRLNNEKDFHAKMPENIKRNPKLINLCQHHWAALAKSINKNTDTINALIPSPYSVKLFPVSGLEETSQSGSRCEY